MGKYISAMEATATSSVRTHLSPHAISSVARKMSALRVFLTSAWQESQDLLLVYQSKKAAEKCFHSTSLYTGYWDCIFVLIHKIQNYLDICLRSGDAGICYGLSAIGAAQEGLANAVSALNQRFDNSLHTRLAEEHNLRAKLIVNGFIAKLGQDYELESLWLQAAEQVYRRTELMACSGKSNNASFPIRRLEKAREYLTNAATYGKSEESVHPEGGELRQLASRQFRRAAVCTILERKHAHLYAAETYQYAASLRDIVPDSSNIKLLQTAVTSMRLAGDMIAVHTDEGSARSDELIVQTITTVKRLSQDAQRLPQLQDSLEEWKAEVATNKDALKKCTNLFIAPALQLLIEKQQQVMCIREQYLHAVIQCESMSDAANELQMLENNGEMVAALITLHIDKLCELTQCVQYFRKRALECDKVSYIELRPMLRRCWEKAAEEAEVVLQHRASLIQGGKLTLMAPALSNHLECCNATIAIYIEVTERILGCAVEYLDKARGAEAGEKNGRDPREAQMWHKAAECMVQEAEQALASISVSSAAQTRPAIQLSDKQSGFVSAAEYLFLSHQHTQPPKLCRLHSQHISALYEQLASLQILRASLNKPVGTVLGNSERLALGGILRFIALLTTSDSISIDTILNNLQACEYGCRYVRAVYTDRDSREVWNRTVKMYFTTHYQQDEIKQVNPREAAAAAVYALAANAMEGGRALFAAACVHAGALLISEHSSYYVALAPKIILAADSIAPSDGPVEVPSELRQLPINDTDAVHFTFLDKHAAALIMLVVCGHQLPLVRSDSPAFMMWRETDGAVVRLIIALTLYVKDMCSGACAPSVESDGLNAFLNVTAECYFAAAKVCSAGEERETWDDAIDICKLAAEVVKRCPGHRDLATTAIEHYVLALNARLKGDTELSTAWDKVARRAREVLLEKVRDNHM